MQGGGAESAGDGHGEWGPESGDANRGSGDTHLEAIFLGGERGCLGGSGEVAFAEKEKRVG